MSTMSPSQLAEHAIGETKIDMIAIQRIKSMGSRQMKETEQSTSAKRFPNSQIGSDNTSMRRRLAERNDNYEILNIVSVKVDGKKVETDTFYKLVKGKLVKA